MASYFAFLSYSHVDMAVAVRLHQWLERFRIPDGLPGSGMTLAPIFRDEDEMGAGELNPKIETALDASDRLIVLASTSAAASKWVTAEVFYFRSRKPQAICQAIIASGRPNATDPSEECFPYSLRYRISNKEITQQRHEIFAPSIQKFGEAGAFLRLAAGLIGVEYRDLYNRHAERQEQERRIRRRLAAKLHTLPAREAFFAGDVERAAKHAFAAIVEGDDYEWSEAPELAAAMPGYLAALPDQIVLRRSYSPLKSFLISDASTLARGRYALAGFKDGAVALWKNGEPRPNWLEPGRPEVPPYLKIDPLSRPLYSPVSSVGMSPDETRLFVGDSHHAGTLFHLDTGTAQVVVRDAGAEFRETRFSESSALLVTCGQFQDINGARAEAFVIDAENSTGIAAIDLPSTVIACSVSSGAPELAFILGEGCVASIGLESPTSASFVELPAQAPFCAEFSSDGASFVVAGADGAVSFWGFDIANAWTERRHMTLSGETVGARPSIYATGDLSRVIVERNDLPTVLIDGDEALPITEFEGGQVTLSPDESKFSITRVDRKTELRSLTDGRVMREWAYEDGASPFLNPTVFSPNGELLAQQITPPNSGTSSIRAFSQALSGIPTGQDEIAIRRISDSVRVAKISLPQHAQLVGFNDTSDGVWYIVNGTELRLRSLDSGRKRRKFACNAAISTLLLSPTNRWIAAITRRGNANSSGLRLIDLCGDGNLREIPLPHEGCQLAFTADGSKLMVTCCYGAICTLDCDNGQIATKYVSYAQRPTLDLVARGGVTIAVGSLEAPLGLTPSPISVVSAVDGSQSRALSQTLEFTALAVSRDGEMIITGEQDGTMRSWDAASGNPLLSVEDEFQQDLRAVGHSVEKQWLVGIDGGGAVLAFSQFDGKLVAQCELSVIEQEFGADAAAVAPDGLSAVASSNGLVNVARLVSGTQYLLGDEQFAPVPPFAYSPESSFLVTACTLGVVLVWRMPDGHLALKVDSVDGNPSAFCFSEDEADLCIGTDSGAIHHIDIKDLSLRGKDLTRAAAQKLQSGLGQLYGTDLDNMILRDLAQRLGGDCDLAVEADRMWPELGLLRPETPE